jgi:hypothetical protein
MNLNEGDSTKYLLFKATYQSMLYKLIKQKERLSCTN